jgi:hypothetical protein
LPKSTSLNPSVVGNGSVPPLPSPDTSDIPERGGFEKKLNPFANIKELRKRHKVLIEGTGDAGVSVTLGPPPKDKFVKFPDDDDWYLPAMVWVDPEDRRRVYYIEESVWGLPDFAGALTACLLCPWMTSFGEFGMWVISTLNYGGGDWRDSSLEAVRQGRKDWRRIHSDNNDKRRRAFPPYEPIPEREWPAELTVAEFYNRAFGPTRFVDSPNHNLVRRLRGLPEV